MAIVGDIDSAEALALVERTWGDVPRGNLQRETSPIEPRREEFRYKRITGEHKQRLLLFHLPAPSILHPDAPPLLVLSAILSDGRSARLFRRLKEDLQIANSVWASYETFEQMGLFKIGAECIADDPLPVEAAIWAEVRRIQTTPVLESELRRVKTRIESSRLYSQEEVFGMARTLATYELLGDYRLADVFTERLHAVTSKDVQRVAQTYLQLPAATLLEYLPAPPTSGEPVPAGQSADRAGASDIPERSAAEMLEAMRKAADALDEPRSALSTGAPYPIAHTGYPPGAPSPGPRSRPPLRLGGRCCRAGRRWSSSRGATCRSSPFGSVSWR